MKLFNVLSFCINLYLEFLLEEIKKEGECKTAAQCACTRACWALEKFNTQVSSV